MSEENVPPHIDECPTKTDPTADCTCEVNGVYGMCPICRRQFSREEITGHESCPSCGGQMPPLHPSGFVEVKVHWFELQVLCSWAEKYALSWQMPHPELKDAVYAITEQLENQHPLKHRLTIARQLGEAAAANPNLTFEDSEIKPIMPKGLLQ